MTVEERKFDPSGIPKCQALAIAKCVAEMVDELFQDPAEEEKYQKWLKERKAKKATQRR